MYGLRLAFAAFVVASDARRALLESRYLRSHRLLRQLWPIEFVKRLCFVMTDLASHPHRLRSRLRPKGQLYFVVG